MKRTSLILSILLLFATNAWAKEACDNNDFRKKYKSYCEGIESSLNESVICSGSFKNKPEYKEYCAKQGYVTTKKKSSIVNKKISTGEINTYFGVEKDKAIKQIVALSKNQLSTEEGEIVYLSQLILDHAKSTGVDKKRKFYSRLKQYVKSTQESIKKLKSGKSRSEARISSRLKNLKKHSEQYGKEFIRNSINQEKKDLKVVLVQKKEREYLASLVVFEIEGDVRGLNVYLDNKKVGTTPLKIKLEPRKYGIKLENEAFKIKDEIDVRKSTYYFGHVNQSQWTSERLVKLNLKVEDSLDKAPQRFTSSLLDLKSTLQESKNFLTQFKKTAETDPKDKKKATELELNIKFVELKLEKDLSIFFEESGSLIELDKKISSINSLNKQLRRKNISRVDIPKKSKYLLFLDLKQAELKVRNNLSAKTIKLSDLDQVNKKGFLIFANSIFNDVNQEIISRDEMVGEYPVGTRQKYNPDYDRIRDKRDRARHAYDRALRQWEEDQYACANQPSKGRTFWCYALLSPNSTEYDRAQNLLERTPRMVEETIYQKYSFLKTKINAKKEKKITVGLINLKTNQIYKEEFTDSDNKYFTIYSGARRDDRRYSRYGGDTREDLESYLNSNDSIKLSTLANEIESYKFTPSTPVISGSLRRYLVSENKKNSSYLAKTNKPMRELISADERFNSVVKIEDAIHGSSGTGFYISQYLVVTNHHVVGDAKIVNIQNFEGQNFTGRVISYDQQRDLALLKVNKKSSPVEFWNSGTLRVGSSVEAIGHPEGYDYSISRGIISSIRELSRSGFGKKVKYLQIDVPINHGNSGGPLYFEDKVVGVNTWGLPKEETEGLNFAIYYQEVIEFLEN